MFNIKKKFDSNREARELLSYGRKMIEERPELRSDIRGQLLVALQPHVYAILRSADIHCSTKNLPRFEMNDISDLFKLRPVFLSSDVASQQYQELKRKTFLSSEIKPLSLTENTAVKLAIGYFSVCAAPSFSSLIQDYQNLFSDLFYGYSNMIIENFNSLRVQ